MQNYHTLNDPLHNKGLAFTQPERDALGLNGWLPYSVLTLEEQLQQRYKNFKAQPNDLAKYIFLSSLQNQNEVLFYRLVHEHIAEMLPLIYTPNIGDVSLQYSLLYSHHRGLYLSYPLKDKIESIIAPLPQEAIEVIVITDGDIILGLGDLGAGGMAIPIGKLAIYTLFGGIHPAKTLPIMLDVGTNNKALLDDPFYIGWRHERILGKEYDDFVDICIKALKKKYPTVLLQWEDFGHAHAKPLLDRYKDEICSFNDDIQGTAAVTLAALIASAKLTQTHMKDQRIVILGGGSAGMGIIHHIFGAMIQQGLKAGDAKKAFHIVDMQGLVHTGQESIPPHHLPFARESSEIKDWDVEDIKTISLLEVVREVRPTILIGASAQPGAFTEEVIKMMAQYVERPVIIPLSNPTSKSEAHPADLIVWTKGKGIIATGSPFDPVLYKGITYPIAQCNNVSIFPGIGLGLVACKSKQTVDAMFYRAAEILSQHSPMLKDPFGTLFPPVDQFRKISQKIAEGVVEIAQQEGLSPKTSQQEIEAMVSRTLWFPGY
jgi:malate dehydrogenase (oxaloacetate-decarboxylating)